METKTAVNVRILVPIDGSELSEQAIAFAACMAPKGAKFYLLRVTPHAEAINGLWGGVVATEAQVAEMTAEDAAADLERATVLIPKRFSVEAEVIAGDPADIIIQTAVRHTVEMIVMASHGRGAVGRWTFGSVADRVARESLVPVMIVCPTTGDPIPPEVRRLVLPYDGSELAANAIPFAIEVAARQSLPVHLVRVINPAAALYPAIARSAPVSDELYQTAFDTEKLTAEEVLAAAAARFKERGVTATTQTVVGPTVTGIESVLERGDVVVITSHGRGGIRRWLLGSIAERLIRDGKAPVVMVPSIGRQRVPSVVPGSVLELALGKA